jgi:hypothetical protein
LNVLGFPWRPRGDFWPHDSTAGGAYMKGIPVISLFMAVAALGSSAVTLRQTADSSGHDQSATVAVQDVKISALQKDVEQQGDEIRRLRWSMGYLRESIDLTARGAGTLDLADKGYCRVEGGNGFFLVSCLDVRPYLDGFKLNLRIGNPLNAEYHGFKLTARWGPRYAGHYSDLEGYRKWSEGMRKREMSFSEALLPGRWNVVEFIIPQTQAGDLACLQLSMETNTVSLGVPWR